MSKVGKEHSEAGWTVNPHPHIAQQKRESYLFELYTLNTHRVLPISWDDGGRDPEWPSDRWTALERRRWSEREDWKH